jgi:hypothetical protein
MTTSLRRRIESLVVQMQSAFLDNPMLSLTLPAAQRRFGVDAALCTGVLDALVDAQVLIRRDGAYLRNAQRSAARPAA